ncbi:unnamed protein product [Camellia sinensis]
MKHGYVLQSLKSISLLDLPELVSISDVTSISPMLKSLIVYNCPKLETLYVNKAPAIKRSEDQRRKGVVGIIKVA